MAVTMGATMAPMNQSRFWGNDTEWQIIQN